MAVGLLAFPSASAHIHNEAAGDAKGIDQCQISLGSAMNPNGEDFHSEVDRVLKILLRKSQAQIKHSMASSHVVVDIEFSRYGQSEARDLFPVMTCDGEGDGGHRCSYFPYPDCHRSRSIFVPESNSTLMTCEEDEVNNQETDPVVIDSNADDRDTLCNRVNDHNDVQVVTCDGEGDGGHRCPYFPCPYCHRSRSIFVPETDYNVHSPNMGCKSTNEEYYPMSRIDGQAGVPVLACPDKDTHALFSLPHLSSDQMNFDSLVSLI